MAEGSPFLRNSYWVLRHGRSIPNEKGLIVSSMENGTLAEFGLASEGFEQAKSAGELFNKELMGKKISLENVRIFYSPFSRTTHTAKTVAEVLGVPFESSQCKLGRFYTARIVDSGSRCWVMEELRERFFGLPLELFSHDKYPEIWALDEKDPFMAPEGGESVADVVSRLATALSAIEAQCHGCTILVISHGDPLQILQNVLHAAKEHPCSGGVDILSRIKGVTVHSILSQHRKFALLTGELRRVI